MDEYEQPSPEMATPPAGLPQVGNHGRDQPPDRGREFPSNYPAPEEGRVTVPSRGQPRGDGSRHLLTGRATGWVVAGVLACTVVGLSVALASTSSPVTRFPAGAVVPGRFGATAPGGFPFSSGSFGGGSGPGRQAVTGTVGSVSASKFTMATPTGETWTVDERSSTTYRKGAAPASAAAVTHGANVLVFGVSRGSTIKATQVVVLPVNGGSFRFPAVAPTL
jgi:hypothetical protein